MQERKQGNDGHLQHIMASLVIIYNLCFDFFFFFDVSYWFVFFLGDGSYCGSSEGARSISWPTCNPCSIYSRLYKKYLQNITSASRLEPLLAIHY